MLRFFGWILVFLLVVAAGLRVTVLRWWRVPDNDPYLIAAIAPTLNAGDWIILWRGSPPVRGDLVLCPEPLHPERLVIGRIAAQAPETVSINGAEIRVDRRSYNNTSACSESSFKVRDPHSGKEFTQHCSMAQLGESIHPRGDIEANRQMVPVRSTLKNDELFLLSDNRQFPYDSRDFGAVPRTSCHESVVFRVVGGKGYMDAATRFTIIP